MTVIGKLESLPVVQSQRGVIVPTQWHRRTNIPPRAWLYGRHYQRGTVTTTIAPGGVGKTSLALCEAVAMVTGLPILGEKPSQKLCVWFVSGEDTQDELDRRLEAICELHDIGDEEIGRLLVDSLVEQNINPLMFAFSDKHGPKLDSDSMNNLLLAIRDQQIDVVTLDPLVAFHELGENDNGAMAQLVKGLAYIANRTDTAIEILHHVRKPAQGQIELTVDDARGGGAFINATRSARVLNRISSADAEGAGISTDDRRFYFRIDRGKQNMAPPEAATWAKLHSVEIENGDNVQAVKPWQFPNAFDNVTTDDMHRIRAVASAGNFRDDVRSPDWIGNEVAKMLEVDPVKEKGRMKKDCGQVVRK